MDRKILSTGLLAHVFGVIRSSPVQLKAKVCSRKTKKQKTEGASNFNGSSEVRVERQKRFAKVKKGRRFDGNQFYAKFIEYESLLLFGKKVIVRSPGEGGIDLNPFKDDNGQSQCHKSVRQKSSGFRLSIAMDRKILSTGLLAHVFGVIRSSHVIFGL